MHTASPLGTALLNGDRHPRKSGQATYTARWLAERRFVPRGCVSTRSRCARLARAELLGALLRDRFAEPQRRVAELRDAPRLPVDPWDVLTWLEVHREPLARS